MLELKVLGGLLFLAWIVTSVWLIKRSSLRTPLKYLDAMIFFPVAIFFLLLTVYLAEITAPELLVISSGFRLRPLDSEMRHAIAVAVSLVMIGLLPGGLFWFWRRFLHRCEARFMAGRRESQAGNLR